MNGRMYNETIKEENINMYNDIDGMDSGFI